MSAAYANLILYLFQPKSQYQPLRPELDISVSNHETNQEMLISALCGNPVPVSFLVWSRPGFISGNGDIKFPVLFQFTVLQQ